MRKLFFTAVMFVACAANAQEFITSHKLAALEAEQAKIAVPLSAGAPLRCALRFDINWDFWFLLWPESAPKNAGAWLLGALQSGGADYSANGGNFKISASGGDVSVFNETAVATATVFMGDLLAALYENSTHAEFGGGLETYALVRSKIAAAGFSGIAAIRRDHNGQYWYSVHEDAALKKQIKWLLAINGVLYGLKIDGGSLALYSKPIPRGGTLRFQHEKPFPPAD